MENKNTVNENLEWHQKPNNVILALLFIFPVGLYYMWKNEIWTSKTRYIISTIYALAFLANLTSEETPKYGAPVTSIDEINKHFIGIWEVDDEGIGATTFGDKIIDSKWKWDVKSDGTFEWYTKQRIMTDEIISWNKFKWETNNEDCIWEAIENTTSDNKKLYGVYIKCNPNDVFPLERTFPMKGSKYIFSISDGDHIQDLWKVN